MCTFIQLVPYLCGVFVFMNEINCCECSFVLASLRLLIIIEMNMNYLSFTMCNEKDTNQLLINLSFSM